MLDRQSFVIEVLEDVALTPDVIAVLTELRANGYTTALDDYSGAPSSEEQIACFDIIKLDYMATKPEHRKQLCRRLKAAHKRILAEKVETLADSEEAAELGCELFQGYYFEKPMVMKKQRHAIASCTAARLMGKLSDDEYRISDLSAIVRHDAHLTYKLINNPHGERRDLSPPTHSNPTFRIDMPLKSQYNEGKNYEL